jgi:hypothetical protein
VSSSQVYSTLVQEKWLRYQIVVLRPSHADGGGLRSAAPNFAD